MRPTIAYVNLTHLENNIQLLQQKAGKRTMFGIIKANAYGHGVIAVLEKMYSMGYRHFGVATLEEALELRASKKDIYIMVLGDTICEDYELARDHDISVCLHNRRDLQNFVKKGFQGLCHLKIDSGMHRIGLQPEELSEVKELIRQAQPDGIFTHMARADEIDKTVATMQVQRFKGAVDYLKEEGIDFQYVHFANTASIMDLDLSFSNTVRAGIALYGLNPSDEVVDARLKPIMSMYSQIVDIRTISEGEGVSYGHRFKADKETVVATLPVGYADGYKRQMSGKARVWIEGNYYPVIGRITMDQIMVDITGGNLSLGAKVELMGDHVTADEWAQHADTINYEIVTTMGTRVPRVYITEEE